MNMTASRNYFALILACVAFALVMFPPPAFAQGTTEGTWCVTVNGQSVCRTTTSAGCETMRSALLRSGPNGGSPGTVSACTLNSGSRGGGGQTSLPNQTTQSQTNTQPQQDRFYPIIALPIPGSGTGVPTTLAQYLNALFQLALGIGAILGVLLLVIGGFEYMTQDALGAKDQGKKRIQGAITGIVLLLLVYLIIYILDPRILSSIDNFEQSVGAFSTSPERQLVPVGSSAENLIQAGAQVSYDYDRYYSDQSDAGKAAKQNIIDDFTKQCNGTLKGGPVQNNYGPVTEACVDTFTAQILPESSCAGKNIQQRQSAGVQRWLICAPNPQSGG